MPELPEVQATVNSIRPSLEGRRIVQVLKLRGDLVRPRDFDLASQLLEDRVAAITRRAKRIVFTMSGGTRWFVHLGMTGRLVVLNAEADVAPHTHAIFRLDDGSELRFVDPRRFGRIVWLGMARDDPSLGPEPLSLRVDEFARRLRQTRRAIKTALLDQRLIAGIGNIYADESLHRGGIHPKKSSHRLSLAETRRLLRAIKSILRLAIRSGGSTIRDYANGRNERGSFQHQLAVYDREDEPCRRCSTKIVRVVLGGRSTHFCPNCQRHRHRARRSLRSRVSS